ncbi:enhancer of polycomb-like-domain-containing protein [Crucibulum laeve]|uniref:Enhancer of polycomb-like protein n=1 Tax=Crucibulum laeve TaxID=68775 RepID=A0A5C3LFL0_9AGAR|nr:enhancer of polycomb-like-domain-containing protein [Crucibulum laeve]
MPRNPHPGASTLRNRNRITNKTRLKIHHGNIDADALLIPDEDEEKNRIANLAAGVDAEDANEHHLQEVLSAAHRTNTSINKSTRATNDKAPPPPPPTAYIPTPDSTGVVDNHEELYPLNRWTDPATYVHTSTTVEESVENGLADGFTYYMDERDKEWLDKNNEEARGEGTSAQGAVSTSGTRLSARGSKGKGKEPESPQPVVVSDDEFELVMGIFEQVTHHKTEFLHHSLETGMTFPAFSDYQETFAAPLPPNMFATYTVPSWIPPPIQLLRIARVIYPYWKERRIERGGHRIIPGVNFDESDTLNESYVCFRRREMKAVRKTRAQQVMSSDKLARLQAEMAYPLQLAKNLLAREKLKKEASKQAQEVWERRMGLVDLRRRFPTLGDKADEELLVDREREKGRKGDGVGLSRVPGLKIKTHDTSTPTPRVEVAIRPSERVAAIKLQINTALARQKDLDHQWEDQIDNTYQPAPIPHTSRLFKYVPPPNLSTCLDSDESDDYPPPARAVRVRLGRGGRRMVDRREFGAVPIVPTKRRRLMPGVGSGEEDKMDTDEENSDEREERRRRMQERWRFDMDDEPAVGPQGADEHDRVLIDDYDSKYAFFPFSLPSVIVLTLCERYLRHMMALLSDPDQQSLTTDPTITVPTGEGRQTVVTPFRLGMPQPPMRRDAMGHVRAVHPGMTPPVSAEMSPVTMQMVNGTPVPVQMVNGTPVPVQMVNGQAQVQMVNDNPMQVQMNNETSVPVHQIRKMAPPGSVSMRISSNGGMRPPSAGGMHANGTQANAATGHTSPPQPVSLPVSQHSLVNGTNGSSRPAISMPHVDVHRLDSNLISAIPAGVVTVQSAGGNRQNQEVAVNGVPSRPKSQNQQQMQALAATAPQLYQQQQQQQQQLQQQLQLQQQQLAGLTAQQMQSLKSAFANMPPQELAAFQAGRGLPTSYAQVGPHGAPVNMPLPATTNINLKLPPNRQIHYGQQVMNGAGGASNMINGHARSPSVNGNRPEVRTASGLVMGMNGQVATSPPRHSPVVPNIAQSHTPPRPPTTPTMAMASPSLQHQQPVGGSKRGY